MILQRQGHDECQLAVIAMLAGKTSKEVVMEAQKWTGHVAWRYYLVVSNREKIWATVSALCHKYGIPSLLVINAITTSTNKPDLTGKGQITIWWTDNTAHAMAFEDGLIYDPNSDTPVTWEIWSTVNVKLYYKSIKQVFVQRI